MERNVWVISTRCESGACVEVAWTKCEAGNCVEVAACQCGVQVRDSKNPDGPVLSFTSEEWGPFVAGVKLGQFDLD